MHLHCVPFPWPGSATPALSPADQRPSWPGTGTKHTAMALAAGASLLLWPALWNGYPIVFDDTGTYLSQAVHRYLGWDRPIFYSLFLFPLHLTLTTWPDIVAQACLAVVTLHLVQRVLLPSTSPWWLVVLVMVLSATTALPWFASQLMPDLFTALLVLALSLAMFTPHRLSPGERLYLVLFSAFAIAAQQSSLALSCAVLLVLTPLRRWLGAAAPLRRGGLAALAAPPLLALAALISVNLAGFHRASPFPFGNVFLLARVIYDGPGMDVLRRDCPVPGWDLCRYLNDFPASSDQFLWQSDSPVVRAGGHKRISDEADAIIAAALHAEPGTELHAWLRNGLSQLAMFDSGDELHACPATVTPWINRDFPSWERTAYAAARQTNGHLAVPGWLQATHRITGWIGLGGCVVVLGVGIRRRHPAAGFAAAVLLAMLLNALIAGGLSAPHHRYGSRVVLLAPLVTLLGGAALLRRDAGDAIARARPGDAIDRARPGDAIARAPPGHAIARARPRVP